MPYISQENRPAMDEIVDLMIEKDVKVNGDLNYVLYAFCKRYINPSYNNYKNYMGELRECANEIGRRILGPYEDTKVIQNGDV